MNSENEDSDVKIPKLKKQNTYVEVCMHMSEEKAKENNVSILNMPKWS